MTFVDESLPKNPIPWPLQDCIPLHNLIHNYQPIKQNYLPCKQLEPPHFGQMHQNVN
uniref:Uncharacterized protein n=1 Tax=Physcomitrium patens TaxID=3218 RepID=A0A2K1JR50_PHYPA|nr:hypothetical protein PHYPA_016392 [Physcomitrium patens]